jgi:hypothetical protein
VQLFIEWNLTHSVEHNDSSLDAKPSIIWQVRTVITSQEPRFYVVPLSPGCDVGVSSQLPYSDQDHHDIKLY